MQTSHIYINTQGENDIINITPQIEGIIQKLKVNDGIIFLNVLGSTAAITTMEFEGGLIADFKRFTEKLAPFRKDYAHNATWNDDNGHSHLRSSLFKTNFFVMVTSGKLDLGTWQQVVLFEFDTRPRQRKIAVKILSGESLDI